MQHAPLTSPLCCLVSGLIENLGTYNASNWSSRHPENLPSTQGMLRDIKHYISTCMACAQAKVQCTLSIEKLIPLPMPQHPLSHIALDIITDLPESQGNTTILGIIDHFSYYLHLIPLPGLPTTFETAKLLFDNVFRCFSIPKGIVSNRGVQFTSRVWKKFNEKPRVFVSLTSSCHPQANGQMEHANQEIGCFLTTVCADNQSDWAHFLPWAEYAQNFLCHFTTHLTLFQCICRFQPPIPMEHQSHWLPHSG